MHPGLILFVVAVVGVAALSQTVAGFGFALIGMPLLVTVLDVEEAIVVVSVGSLLNATLVTRQTWDEVPRRTVAVMLLAAFAGMPLGLAALLLAPQDALRIAVGISAVVMAIAMSAGLRIGGNRMVGEIVAGGLSGVLSTSTGMNGPPVVIYLQDRGLRPRAFRGALSSFFWVSGVVSMALLGASGVITWRALALGAIALPAVVVGNWCGSRLAGRVSDAAFRVVVLGMLVGTSVVAVGLAVGRVIS
jgi:uncharacterized membrane protein YfcA